LISHNYYSKDAFWKIYNQPNYDAVKRLTDRDHQFRDLYEKTCQAAMGRASPPQTVGGRPSTAA
jgi:hypothetical protein